MIVNTKHKKKKRKCWLHKSVDRVCYRGITSLIFHLNMQFACMRNSSFSKKSQKIHKTISSLFYFQMPPKWSLVQKGRYINLYWIRLGIKINILQHKWHKLTEIMATSVATKQIIKHILLFIYQRERKQKKKTIESAQNEMRIKMYVCSKLKSA